MSHMIWLKNLSWNCKRYVLASRSEKTLPFSFSAFLSTSGNITNLAVVVIMIALFDVSRNQVGIEAGYLVWNLITCVHSIENNRFQAVWIWFICPCPIQDVPNWNVLLVDFNLYGLCTKIRRDYRSNLPVSIVSGSAGGCWVFFFDLRPFRPDSARGTSNLGLLGSNSFIGFPRKVKPPVFFVLFNRKGLLARGLFGASLGSFLSKASGKT